MEREEIERAAECLLALPLADKDERRAIALAVARRLSDIPDEQARIVRSHNLIRVVLDVVGPVARVRFLAVWAWERPHGELSRLIGVSRSMAQTIARRPGKRLPWEQ